MLNSVGALFKAKNTGRFFFIQRSQKSSYANRFGLVGGKVHANENLLEGLSREVVEEIGFMPSVIRWINFNKFVSEDRKFEYDSILILTPSEFIPKLNSENEGYAWTRLDNPPRPLHPRLKELFSNDVLVSSIIDYH